MFLKKAAFGGIRALLIGCLVGGTALLATTSTGCCAFRKCRKCCDKPCCKQPTDSTDKGSANQK